MPLKVYLDMMSQPCRALYLFLQANQIPYETQLIHLRKADHLSDEFKAINRFQRVPAIDADGFKLSESPAIYAYLKATTGKVADHWLPSEARARARVEEFLSWQHLNLRAMASLVFRARVLGGTPLDDPKVQRMMGNLEPVLDVFEREFLKGGGWVNDMPQISVADLVAVTELEQPVAAGHDIFAQRPKIAAYVERVRKGVGAELYDQAHKICHTVRDRVKEGKL